jgi:integrase
MARSTEPVFRRPGGLVYYAWVPDPRTGRSVRKSTGCRSQGDAIAWRRRYVRTEQDPAGESARTVTLQGVLDDFLESSGARTKTNGRPLSTDTLEFYQAKASMVAAVLGADTLASKVDASAIDAYLKARRADRTQRGERVTDHTISKELAVLRAALQRAKRLGKWRGDLDAVFPSAGDFSPGYDPRKSGAKALSREDVARLFAATPMPDPSANGHERRAYRFAMGRLAVVAFGIACGAELAALARARRDDVTWCPDDPGRSVVHVRGTKNEHRNRIVPIATLEQALLLDFALRHSPGAGALLFPSLGNIRRDMHFLAKRAGVRAFSPHVLRHTLGKWLRSGGVDSATTGALLGHADGRMVERIYGRLDRAEDARSAIVAQYRPPASTATPTRAEGELFLYGNGGGSGAPRHPWQNGASTEAAIFAEDPVRRGGIEPPTRGFSVPCSTD